MLCEECKQRPATVHLTKIVNNQKTEMHLCQECAQERGELGFMGNIQINFPNLLSGFFDLDQHFNVEEPFSEELQEHCPSCGLSYNDFRELGQLGCSTCYKTFGEQMEPILRRIHGHTRHTGKVPRKHAGKLSLERKVENLKGELKEAVLREEYEKAAQLRDEVHALEKKLGRDNRG